MTRSDTRQGTPLHMPWWILACVAAVLTVLAGCATPAGGMAGASAGREIITESDEPEARRRARIRLELAVGYYQQGRTNIALDEVKQALASDPTYGPAHNLHGLIYMRLNDLGQAEQSFRRSLALQPGDPEVLHNVGWLACQQSRWDESLAAFQKTLANPSYGARAKTYLTMGLCQARAGRVEEAEHSLARSYELDAGNPVTGYNLASLLMQRGELERAQFYIRRLNNSELANAESLWLGIKVERRIGDQLAMSQLADQLRKRYPGSRELLAYDRGAFNE